jgi:hypothetical protein
MQASFVSFLVTAHDTSMHEAHGPNDFKIKEKLAYGCGIVGY